MQLSSIVTGVAKVLSWARGSGLFQTVQQLPQPTSGMVAKFEVGELD
jgi:hypothetical protein